jgi:hypothetical protein
MSLTFDCYRERLALISHSQGCPSSMAKAVLVRPVKPLSRFYQLIPITCETHCHPLHSLMSHPNPSTSSSPNFELIFNDALKVYKRRTKNDLLAHPLVAQLQDCNSSSAILAVIHEQFQQFHQSREGNERLTKWLDPTVKVLYSLSETLGGGVSLVCLRKLTRRRFTPSYPFSRCSLPRK